MLPRCASSFRPDVHLAYEDLPFPTDYAEDGSLALPLAGFADVRLVVPLAPQRGGATAAATAMGGVAVRVARAGAASGPQPGAAPAASGACGPDHQFATVQLARALPGMPRT
jgi:hypothetical protein